MVNFKWYLSIIHHQSQSLFSGDKERFHKFSSRGWAAQDGATNCHDQHFTGDEDGHGHSGEAPRQPQP